MTMQRVQLDNILYNEDIQDNQLINGVDSGTCLFMS